MDLPQKAVRRNQLAYYCAKRHKRYTAAGNRKLAVCRSRYAPYLCEIWI